MRGTGPEVAVGGAREADAANVRTCDELTDY